MHRNTQLIKKKKNPDLKEPSFSSKNSTKELDRSCLPDCKSEGLPHANMVEDFLKSAYTVMSISVNWTVPRHDCRHLYWFLVRTN